MTIADQIKKALIDFFESGMSQQELAKKTGLGQSYLCELRSGKRAIEGLTIRKVMSLFPYAKIDLTGDNTNIHNSGNIASNIKGNNTQSIVDRDCDKRIDKILDTIMSSDKFPPESKIEAYNIFKGILATEQKA